MNTKNGPQVALIGYGTVEVVCAEEGFEAFKKELYERKITVQEYRKSAGFYTFVILVNVDLINNEVEVL